MWLYLSLFKALDSAVTGSLTKHLTKRVYPTTLVFFQTLFSLLNFFICIADFSFLL
jgi:hypothetical protein